ncbi:MAG: hypothetical protein ACRD3N_16195 [Terracidiphilus sp.]
MNTNRSKGTVINRGWLTAALLIVALAGVVSTPAWSQDVWTGASGRSWFTSRSWSAGVPTSSSTAEILNTTNNPVLLQGSSASVSTLEVGASNTLKINDSGALYVYGGSISNAGTINLGDSTLGVGYLDLASNTTLSGAGTMNMAGGQIGTNGSNYTLTNDAQIQGSGLIGSDVGSLYQNVNVNNEAGGALIANQAGGTLQIGGTGTLTNNGAMFVDDGSTLKDTAFLSNFSGSTLAEGIYSVDGAKGNAGTLELNLGSNSGGNEITTDSANIELLGPTASITDDNGNNALGTLSTISSTGSLYVSGGQAFYTAASSFTNDGILHLEAGSTFTDSDFAESSTGTFFEGINSGAQSGAGEINVDGNIILDSGSTLLVDVEYGSPAPPNGADYSWIIMDSTNGGTVNGTFTNVDFYYLPAGDTWNVNYGTPGEVILDVNGATSVPEGGAPWMYLLLMGATCFGAVVLSRRRQAAVRL